MKYYLAVLVACLGISLPLHAQESATLPPELQEYITTSRSSDAQLLKNSSEILKRLGFIEQNLVSQTPTAPISALEARLAELEAKLAAVPAPSLVVSPDPTPTSTEAADKVQKNLNIAWIVLTAALVFFMQAGFCLLEIGLTRAKNAINICMKNFLDFCVGTLCFFFVGFALMFGASQNGWIGLGPFWLSATPGDSSFWAFWLFQAVFAGTAATIISGAMAERTKFVGYLIYTAMITSLIYPIAGHWVWGSFGGGFGYGGDKGWLEALGYIDFAGSSVVHAIGGAASLAGVLIVGPRIGRFRADGEATLIPGHNLPMAALGTFILWFGWFGFNAGSTLLADANIGRIAVNTTIAPAAGAIAGMFAMWLHQGRPDIGMTLNGALGGLVGITASCHCVTPASAVLIGLVAGVIATAGSLLLERARIDDAVGAIPVHLMCGVWGILGVAIFHEAGFSSERLGIQALGVASIVGFTFFASLIGFWLIDKMVGLRAKDSEQELGLDFTEHSGAAYPDFMTGE